jgi:predicted GNAT family N-acyltransferase
MAPVTRFCFVDQDRDLALVAECRSAPASLPTIRGLARLRKGSDGQSGRVVLQTAVRDRELATILLQQLIQVARREGLQCLEADITHPSQLADLYQPAGFGPAPRHSKYTLQFDLPPP